MALRATKELFNRLYTSEEFAAMPASSERFELIDGKLVEKPVPKYDHSRIVMVLIKAYLLFDPNEEVGEVIHETMFRLSTNTAPVPDLSFYSVANKPLRDAPLAPTPDLAIEVQSPGQSKSTLQKKMTRYLQSGVRLGWLILPKDRLVEVYRPGQAETEVLTIDDILSSEDVIPGFRMAIKTLFE